MDTPLACKGAQNCALPTPPTRVIVGSMRRSLPFVLPRRSVVLALLSLPGACEKPKLEGGEMAAPARIERAKPGPAQATAQLSEAVLSLCAASM